MNNNRFDVWTVPVYGSRASGIVMIDRRSNFTNCLFRFYFSSFFFFSFYFVDFIFFLYRIPQPRILSPINFWNDDEIYLYFSLYNNFDKNYNYNRLTVRNGVAWFVMGKIRVAIGDKFIRGQNYWELSRSYPRVPRSCDARPISHRFNAVGISTEFRHTPNSIFNCELSTSTCRNC